jgi:hypothetical protein
MEFTPDNVQGATFYAGFLSTFLTIGLFTLFILTLAFIGFFPSVVRKYIALSALGCSAMQWVFLSFDVMKYDWPWYYGLVDPFRAITDPESYSALPFFLGLVLPSLGIICVTGLSIAFVVHAFVFPQVIECDGNRQHAGAQDGESAAAPSPPVT